MPFVSYLLDGIDGFGFVDNEAVYPLKNTQGGCRSLKELITRYPDSLHGQIQTDGNSIPLSDIDYQPVIPHPGKIFCIGLNYHAHRIETGNQENEYPTVFTRFASCLVAHQEEAWRPAVSEKMDFEGELAVIIGKPGRHISKARALDHVAGYACFNDISIRDWQRHSSQFTPGKNFTRTGAFGPWMMSRKELPDPFALTLETRLNGTVMQQTTTDLMIFDIPALINYVSTFNVLEPGDVIVTGTPGGVGVKRKPPVYMKPGDKIEIEISGIGTLVNRIIDEPSDSALV